MRPGRFYLLLTLLFTAGCASLGTYNPATGRSEFILIPTQEEVAMGKDVHKQLLKKYKLSEDKAKIARIERIGQRLAQISDRKDYTYRFFLIEEKDLNAFTTPGGRIYVFTGLLDKLASDDQIAGVLAHEIGHCAARHTIKKFQAAVGYQLIGGIILQQIGAQEQALKIAQLSSNTVMQLVFSAYGRQDEYEADRLGLKYMQLAGYDLDAMMETLKILKQASKGAKVPVILRTHPHLDDRIAAVQQEMERVRREY